MAAALAPDTYCQPVDVATTRYSTAVVPYASRPGYMLIDPLTPQPMLGTQLAQPPVAADADAGIAVAAPMPATDPTTAVSATAMRARRRGWRRVFGTLGVPVVVSSST